MIGIAGFFRGLKGRSEDRPGIRCAHVYRRGDKYYVTASSQTRDGFWLVEGSVAVLEVGASARLADAVRSALSRSRVGILAPKDWSSWTNRVTEAAGYKRFSAFAKGTSLVSIAEEAGTLRIQPSRNGGSREGFVGLEDQTIEIAQDSPDLAQSIEKSFDRCR